MPLFECSEENKITLNEVFEAIARTVILQHEKEMSAADTNIKPADRSIHLVM